MIRSGIVVVVLMLFSLFTLTVCVLCALTALEQHKYSSTSFSWAEGAATILLSKVDKKVKTRPNQKFDKIKYSYDILYEYTVKGHVYQSNRVSLGSLDSSLAGVNALAEKYSEGDVVTVYYDENHPEYSVLDFRSGNSGVYVLALVALISGGISLLSFSFLVKYVTRNFLMKTNFR